MLTAERLREVLHYDPDTGEFRWRIKGSARRRTVGSRRKRGYIQIGIDGRSYQAHRLAYLWMIGVWPSEQVDHINRNPSDNRWSNLRAATHSENARNHNLNRNNTSGANGVHFEPKTQKWRVRLNQQYYGLFATKEEATQIASSLMRKDSL